MAAGHPAQRSRQLRRRSTSGKPPGGDRLSVGVGATILTYALASAVKLPHTWALALGAGGLAMITTPYVPWRRLGRRLSNGLGRAVQTLVENGRNQAAADACRAAAEALDALLASHFDSFWLEARLWGARKADRRLIDDYHRHVQQVVMNAVDIARQTITVPESIMHYAKRPRSATDLKDLRDWMWRMSDEREQ